MSTMPGKVRSVAPDGEPFEEPEVWKREGAPVWFDPFTAPVPDFVRLVAVGIKELGLPPFEVAFPTDRHLMWLHVRVVLPDGEHYTKIHAVNSQMQQCFHLFRFLRKAYESPSGSSYSAVMLPGSA